MTGRTTRRGAVLALLVAGAVAVAGCGGSDDAADSTTTATPTVATTAPAATAPATTAPATTAPPEPQTAGDAAAGEAAFAAAPCANCHADLGNAAGVGPKLAGAGLTEAEIRTVIQNGRGVMPAGLVEGQELADITAYVVSLQ